MARGRRRRNTTDRARTEKLLVLSNTREDSTDSENLRLELLLYYDFLAGGSRKEIGSAEDLCHSATTHSIVDNHAKIGCSVADDERCLQCGNMKL